MSALATATISKPAWIVQQMQEPDLRDTLADVLTQLCQGRPGPEVLRNVVLHPTWTELCQIIYGGRE